MEYSTLFFVFIYFFNFFEKYSFDFFLYHNYIFFFIIIGVIYKRKKWNLYILR